MKKLLCALLVVFTALALLGCDNKPLDQAEDNPDGQGVGHITQTEVIYLGVLLPLTGQQADEAARAKTAMETAVNIINNSHDINWELAQSAGLSAYGNATVELRFADAGDNTLTCLDAVRSLIDLGVSAVIGAYDPQMTASAALVCKKSGIPFISGSAKGNRLSDGGYNLGEGFFHIGMSTDQETQLLWEYVNQINIKNDLGIKNTAIAYADDSLGNGAALPLEKIIADSTMKNVAMIAYDPLDNDLVEEAGKMVSNQPEVLFQVSRGRDLAAFVYAYSQSKYLPKAIMCYSEGYWKEEFLLAAAEHEVDYYLGCSVRPDLLYPAPPEGTEDHRYSATRLFAYINGLYRDAVHQDMSSSDLLEFAAVIVAAQAVAAAGTTEAQALIDTLHETAFEAPYLYSGSIAFDQNGQNSIMPAYISRAVGGRYVYEY